MRILKVLGPVMVMGKDGRDLFAGDQTNFRLVIINLRKRRVAGSDRG